MPKTFRLEGLVQGNWQEIVTVEEHHQRFFKHDIDLQLSGIRFTLDETWGSEESRVYAFIVG